MVSYRIIEWFYIESSNGFIQNYRTVRCERLGVGMEMGRRAGWSPWPRRWLGQDATEGMWILIHGADATVSSYTGCATTQERWWLSALQGERWWQRQSGTVCMLILSRSRVCSLRLWQHLHCPQFSAAWVTWNVHKTVGLWWGVVFLFALKSGGCSDIVVRKSPSCFNNGIQIGVFTILLP